MAYVINFCFFFWLLWWVNDFIINIIIVYYNPFANGPGDRGSVLGRVIPKTQKWYLIPPCLRLGIIRYWSRVKWNNPGNGLAPFPTPKCSRYWKGSLRVTPPDYGRQLYLLYFTIFLFSVFQIYKTNRATRRSPVRRSNITNDCYIINLFSDILIFDSLICLFY